MKALLLLVSLTAACAGTVRSPAAYRDDTAQLLASRQAQVKTCYDAALATDATLAGTITVAFVVEKKTGVVKQASVVPEKSQGSEKLYTCVLTALTGLRLAPADRNEGRATFVYELKPTPS